MGMQARGRQAQIQSHGAALQIPQIEIVAFQHPLHGGTFEKLGIAPGCGQDAAPLFLAHDQQRTGGPGDQAIESLVLLHPLQKIAAHEELPHAGQRAGFGRLSSQDMQDEHFQHRTGRFIPVGIPIPARRDQGIGDQGRVINSQIVVFGLFQIEHRQRIEGRLRMLGHRIEGIEDMHRLPQSFAVGRTGPPAGGRQGGILALGINDQSRARIQAQIRHDHRHPLPRPASGHR